MDASWNARVAKETPRKDCQSPGGTHELRGAARGAQLLAQRSPIYFGARTEHTVLPQYRN